MGELDPIGFLRKLKADLEHREGDHTQELYHKIALILKYEDALEFYIGEKSIKYFIPDPSITLKTLLERSAKKILFMSATAQSKEVLNEIYKIDPIFVEGETRFPGLLIRQRTGKEEVVNYQKWEKESFRKKYWQVLQEILEVAEKPILVNVHGYKYLPKERIGLIPSQYEVEEYQDLAIVLFLERGGIVFATKLDRGIDLKGEKARSIVMTKYPYALRNDPILLAMAKRLGKEKFEIYYQDLADRTFVQSVGRVLRAKDDFAEFWSPDLRCHEALLELWDGDIL
jgi:Rad3-related DNA helicase